MAKILLSLSAAFLGAIGLGLNFAPGEVAARLGLGGLPAATVILQILAGLLIGLAVINWMLRDSLASGARGRPLGLGNALHFAVGAFALGHALSAGLTSTPAVALFAAYLSFAFGFLYIVFVASTPVLGDVAPHGR